MSGIVLQLTAFIAAIVSGAVGYGFSTITVPVGLAVLGSRILNPALVLVEVALNTASLVVNRRGIRSVAPFAARIGVGLIPGVAIGAALLNHLPGAALKAATYAVLLPLIVIQLMRARAVPPPPSTHQERAFGLGLGLLYATTTISGPPLALFFTRYGLTHDRFRAALALLRVAESTLTLAAYLMLGLVTADSALLAVQLLPAVVVGLPLGRMLAGHIKQGFVRVVLVVDVVFVSLGLTLTLQKVFT